MPEPRPPVPPLPLATGELSPRDARELDALLSQIRAVTGLEGSGYKERYLRRRLGVRMRRLGLERYGAYAESLRQDEDEYARLLDAIAINVSRFYRNGSVWTTIRDRVVPDLFAPDVPRIRVWSAGSASGEEAYTLAMVLAEHARRTGTGLGRFEVLGTDIDAAALERARLGTYDEAALQELPAELAERWLEPDGGEGTRTIRPELRRRVRFEALDLTAAMPEGPVHLGVCRNVLIYLERSVQERVLQGLAELLDPGGYLVLGKAEMLVGPARDVFRPIATRERVYQRP